MLGNNKGNKIVIYKGDVFEQNFKDYYRPLCFYANKFLDDLEASKDIVQDTFIKLWNKQLEFENTKVLSTYLYNSVRNNALTYIDKNTTRRRINNTLEFEKSEDHLLRKEIEAEVIDEIYKAIEELPGECKKVFKLSYINGLKVQEVAEDLNISVNTVKTQRLRAKKFLKERLKDNYWVFLLLFV